MQVPTTRELATPRPAMVGRPAWRQPVQLGAIGAAAVAYTGLVDPNLSHAFPFCPLKLVTGIDCPVCGSLRATHSLVHGHIAAAAGHNLLFVLAVPFILYAWVTWIASATGWPVRRWHVPARVWPAVAVLAIGFMVLRNLPVAPLHWLASA